MNKSLTNEIVLHILNKFKVFEYNKDFSLISEDFKLSNTISITFEENNEIENFSIYSAKLKSIDDTLTVFFTKIHEEYILLLKFKSYSYGVYMNKESSIMSNIYISINENWAKCDTYGEATLLAGLEYIKTLNISWEKHEISDDEFKILNSFIDFTNI